MCVQAAFGVCHAHDAPKRNDIQTKVEGMTNRSSTAGQICSNDDGRNDLEKALDYIRSELGECYDMSVLRNQSPVNYGFPMLRPRWYAARHINYKLLSCNIMM